MRISDVSRSSNRNCKPNRNVYSMLRWHNITPNRVNMYTKGTRPFSRRHAAAGQRRARDRWTTNYFCSGSSSVAVFGHTFGRVKVNGGGRFDIIILCLPSPVPERTTYALAGRNKTIVITLTKIIIIIIII